jgi:hypothetical protein
MRHHPDPADARPHPGLGERSDRLYLDELLAIAQNRHADESAGGVVVTEVAADDLPCSEQIGLVVARNVDGCFDHVLEASAGSVQGRRFAITCSACPATSPAATVSPDSSSGHAPAVKTSLEQSRATAA